jgi:hypothetical protein
MLAVHALRSNRQQAPTSSPQQTDVGRVCMDDRRPTTFPDVSDGPHVFGRVAVIEYQGPVVRVALTTDAGVEAAALVPDQQFYRQSVGVGDPATLSWPAEAAHELAH